MMTMMMVMMIETGDEKENARALLIHREEGRGRKRAYGKHGQHWRINGLSRKRPS